MAACWDGLVVGLDGRHKMIGAKQACQIRGRGRDRGGQEADVEACEINPEGAQWAAKSIKMGLVLMNLSLLVFGLIVELIFKGGLCLWRGPSPPFPRTSQRVASLIIRFPPPPFSGDEASSHHSSTGRSVLPFIYYYALHEYELGFAFTYARPRTDGRVPALAKEERFHEVKGKLVVLGVGISSL